MWKSLKLEDLVTLQNGYAFKSSEYSDDGYFVMRITNVQQGYIAKNNPKFIQLDNTPKLAKFILSAGDILLSLTGDVGRVGIINEEHLPAVLNQRVARVVNKDTNLLDTRYLFHFLNSKIFRHQVESFAHGAAQANVSTKDISQIGMEVPPLAEQQRIVAKLDATFAEIDAAIDLTMQKNENTSVVLNQFLTTIKADTVKLDDIVQIKTGKLDANAMVEGGEYPFFTCSKQIYEIDKFAFDCDAVLLAGNNASGDFNVKHYTGKFNAYQRTYVITVKDTSKLRSRYLYFQLIQALAKFKTMSVGTNTKFLKLGMIKSFEIPLPSIAQQDAILKKLQKLEQNLQILEDSSTLQLSNYFALKSAILAQELQSEAA